MKISMKAINQFRCVCKNEESSPDDLVRYKIERDFLLGTHITTPHENTYVVAFGTLRIKMVNDTIVAVYRGKKCYPVNSYAKHKYDSLLKENKIA